MARARKGYAYTLSQSLRPFSKVNSIRLNVQARKSRLRLNKVPVIKTMFLSQLYPCTFPERNRVNGTK